jgi:hypothetical protein
MSFDYATSFGGFRAAVRSLAEAANKIANINKSSNTQNEKAKAEDMDLPGALIQADKAKIDAEANLKFIQSQNELDNKVLDVFG